MDQEPPPSYSAATSRDYWPIISPYIRSEDLYSASLVCRRWHELFGPRLWGSPTSHFEAENESVYNALTRFRRVLSFARPFVRQWTHTLSMPPAHTETYEGPQSDWLRDIVVRLPCLQSLIVDRLPFFDHNALLALRYWDPASEPQSPKFPLALLSAEGCPNATYVGLSEALKRFHCLSFLNLSRLPVARSHAVLSQLSRLQNLQVLKLHHVGLEDEDLDTVARNISLRLRCLDIRHNRLTDASAASLATHCFRKLHPQTTEHSSTSHSLTNAHRHSLVQVQFENLEEHLVQGLVDGTADCLCHVDPGSSGITHLHVAGNFLSAKGISTLIQTSCLSVLDAGSIIIPRGNREAASAGQDGFPEGGAETLLSSLSEDVSLQLRYLRIHHSLVTAAPPSKPQAVGRPTISAQDTEGPDIRSPGPIDLAMDQSHNGKRSGSPGPLRSPYLELVNGRKNRSDQSQTSARAFYPRMLPNLRTLVLTDVPSTTASFQIHSRIIDLIKACADELHVARKEARASYACPPGRARKVYERDYVKSIFALERIVLELEDPNARDSQTAPANWRAAQTYSATEDPDSEAYWAAAQHDFTFFEDEGPRISKFKNTNARLTAEKANVAESTNESTPRDVERVEGEHRDSKNPSFHVISEISKFRRERKTVFESVRGRFPDTPFVEGHWDGAIQVVRP